MSTNLLPLVKKDPSDRARLLASRIGIVIGGGVAVIGALNARVVFNTMLDANMLMLAAVIVPFILGVWWKKANRAGALTAMWAGIAAWFVTSVSYPHLPGDLVGFVASLATMLLVTPLTQSIDPPRPLVDHDGNEVDLSNRLGLL